MLLFLPPYSQSVGQKGRRAGLEGDLQENLILLHQIPGPYGELRGFWEQKRQSGEPLWCDGEALEAAV